MSETVFCRKCGKELQTAALICPACNAPQKPGRYKDRTTAALLAFFFGGLGVHRFYLGQWWGIFYLVFCWTLIPGLVALVEFIVFLCRDSAKWDQQYNEGVDPSQSNNTVIWLILGAIVLFFGVAIIGILAAIAIPAYQDYTMRAQTITSYDTARRAAIAVDEYYTKNEALPADLKASGFNEVLPKGVERIDLDQDNGTLTVRYSSPALQDKTLSLSPSRDEQNKIVWTCSSASIKPTWLPKDCRTPAGSAR